MGSTLLNDMKTCVPLMGNFKVLRGWGERVHEALGKVSLDDTQDSATKSNIANAIVAIRIYLRYQSRFERYLSHLGYRQLKSDPLTKNLLEIRDTFIEMSNTLEKAYEALLKEYTKNV